jgi:hypothetical protein
MGSYCLKEFKSFVVTDGSFYHWFYVLDLSSMIICVSLDFHMTAFPSDNFG